MLPPPLGRRETLLSQRTPAPRTAVFPRKALALGAAGVLLAVGVLIGALAVYSAGAATGGDVEVRINAKRLDGGQVEFALQQRAGAGWSERIQPQARILPADAPLNRWLNSTPVAVGPNPACTGLEGGLRITAVAPLRVEHGESGPSAYGNRFAVTNCSVDSMFLSYSLYAGLGEMAFTSASHTADAISAIAEHWDWLEPRRSIILPDIVLLPGSTVEFVGYTETDTSPYTFRVDESGFILIWRGSRIEDCVRYGGFPADGFLPLLPALQEVLEEWAYRDSRWDRWEENNQYRKNGIPADECRPVETIRSSARTY